MGYSRTGGAIVKMPLSNFSQRGLASIFGINLDDDTKANQDSDNKAHSKTAHNKTAIIAGTVCGVVGLILLGGFVAWQRRENYTNPEDLLYVLEHY